MNPILVEQMAKYKMDTFDREAEVAGRVALAKQAAVRPSAVHDRLTQTTGRLRLVLRRIGA